MDFDHAKDALNIAKHGISLARAADLDIRAALQDTRESYGEVRYRAWGLLDGLPHCLAFTVRNGAIRPISLRRCHQREFARHVRIRTDP